MIKLYYNNSYKWYNVDNTNVIGFAFFKGKLYKDLELAKLLSKNNIDEIIKKLNGCFSIVKEFDNKIILYSDPIRCFPVFYNINGDISDNISDFKGEINEIAIEEMNQCRWVSGDKTIYKDVYQLEAGQIVTISNQKIKKHKHFEYKIKEGNFNFEELDNVLNNVFNRLIKYLNGRKAVIPLSGGQDSRLLAYYLKKNNYSNVIAYTYGNKKGEEVQISKKVAEFLDIPWYFIEYTQKNCQKMYYKSNQKQLFNYYGRGYSIPLFQELTAISELLECGIIDKDCVILPGFTLDFLSGSHVPFEFMENKKVSKKIIMDLIYQNNYNLTKISNKRFDLVLNETMNLEFNNKKINVLNAEEIFEQYDFNERQAKFINNGIRNYDYFGLKWYLPFWDKELIDFFIKLPLKEKYNRKFFKEFVEFKYKDLMEYAPIYKINKNSFKGSFKLIQKIKYLFYNYHNNPLNLYYYFKFSIYLKYILLHKNFNYDYYIGKDYEKIIRKENKNGV